MGCGDGCPFFPGKRYEEWQLDDPAGLDVEAVRPVPATRSNVESARCSTNSTSLPAVYQQGGSQ